MADITADRVDMVGLVECWSRILRAVVVDDVDQRERADLQLLVAATARVSALAESVRLKAATRLVELADATGAFDAEQVLGAASRTSKREATATTRRARAVATVPQLGDALAAGDVSADHVDAVAQALARLEPDERARLASEGAWIAQIAANCSPDELAAALRRRVRQLSVDDGVARFERQRRATTLRHWNDPTTGMVCLYGEFDPESGAALIGRLQAAVEALFHSTVPDTCPDDERKQGHLRALALIELCTRGIDSNSAGTGTGPPSHPGPEFLVVIDDETLFNGLHPNSRVEVTGGVELPIETIRRLACTANIIPVVLNSHGVALDLGRARRLATVHQRRALRAMYSTCAVPECSVHFDHCKMHHIVYWDDGGLSNLDNFIPLCSRHHHMVHEGGWKVHLQPATRVLTITMPNGTTRANPPPFARSA